MALKQTRTVKGVKVQDCYIKVQGIQGDKSFMHATLAFCAGAGEQPFDLQTVIFEPKMDGSNFISQAYEHVKQLPEFADAVDC